MNQTWSGEVENCDYCEDVLSGTFFDAKLPPYGQWAKVCPDCFRDEGCSLGIGRGQEYKKRPNGSWVKTAG